MSSATCFRGLLLLGLLLIRALGQPVAAAQTDASVDFIEVSAEAHFPETIDFKLVARTGIDIESVDLYWRLAGSDALTLAEPDFTVMETLQANHQADMSSRFLPPGLDIEFFWRVSGRDGSVHESPVSTLLYTDERFEWQSLDGGLVSVWWYSGSDAFARDILNAANRTLLHLDESYGLRTGQQIRIMVYGDSRDFGSALPPNSADWIGGVAYPPLNHVVAQIRPGGGSVREISRMVPHEVSHVVVHQASRNPYNSPPPWLDEGLATYVQELDDGRLNPVLDRAVREGHLIPLNALKSSFPADPDRALLSYAESLSVVAYLVETYGSATVGNLVSAYRVDMSHDDAIESVLGLTIEELDAHWKSSLGYGGDRPLDRGRTDANTREIAIVVTAIAISLVIAVSVVILALWKTRAYREVQDEEVGMSEIDAHQTGPQP